MFEKLKSYIDQGRSMLEEAFDLPLEDDFVTVPEGVTCEQLIEEAKQYVNAIIVPHKREKETLPGQSEDQEKSDSLPDQDGQSEKAESPETNDEDNKQEV